jgi:putative NADH-flavin reductase
MPTSEIKTPAEAVSGRRRVRGDQITRLTIFGATGGTGQQLVRLALERGHDVTAIARDPTRIATRHDRLAVCPADVLRPESLAASVDGADAVISALGNGASRAHTTIYSAGVANILEAMRAAGVRRLVAISAAPLAPRSEATAPARLLVLPLLHRLFGATYADMRRMEDLLHASGAEWSVLRPPRLTNGPATGRYRTAHDGNVRGGRRITRADLATAILDLLADPDAVRATIGVAN